MRVPDIAQAFLVILPFLLVGEAVIAAVIWGAAGGKGGAWARLAVWLGLTTLTVWFGSAVAFVAVHALLFFVGPTAAILGLVATTIFMLTMPIGWALVIRRNEPGHAPSRA